MFKAFVVVLSLFTLSHPTLQACTDFRIDTSDGSFINGRTMEFHIPLFSKIVFHERQEKCYSLAPNLQKGLEWTSKYGFVSIVSSEFDYVIDGLNEEGLSVGTLWFPSAIYQDPSGIDYKSTLAVQNFGNWVLANFSSVEEVKQALPNICVWGLELPLFGTPFPLHFAIHDANGNSLVVEFINGQQEVSENPNGVLTNFPPLDWHLTNLRNYVNLSGIDASSMDWRGIKVEQTGHGSGLLGLPGDWTPPSRFVRISLLKHFARKVDNAKAGVNLAQHLLNAVDITKGTVSESNLPLIGDEFTQWAVVKDLTNKIYYYRTYDDLTLKSIDLKEIDFESTKSLEAISLH